MTPRKLAVVFAISACMGACGDSTQAAPAPIVEVLGEDGKALISADQIRGYDWSTHTLTLASKVGERLADQLLQTRRLVSGVAFKVAVDGKPIYAGNFTSTFSSKSFSTAIILVGAGLAEDKLGPDQLRIQLGYPSPQFFKGADPRADPRLRKALHAAGKLIAPKES